MYLLSNMAILGIYVKFREGYTLKKRPMSPAFKTSPLPIALSNKLSDRPSMAKRKQLWRQEFGETPLARSVGGLQQSGAVHP